jgi:hypothetical protein
VVEEVMVTDAVFETAPLRVSRTRTAAVPASWTSAAVMAACTVLPLTYDVLRLDPFQSTTDLRLKFAPLIRSVKAVDPAETAFGERLETLGVGGVAETWQATRNSAAAAKRNVESKAGA